MEDWLKCQISPLVKYRLNQTKPNLIQKLTFQENTVLYYLLYCYSKYVKYQTKYVDLLWKLQKFYKTEHRDF